MGRPAVGERAVQTSHCLGVRVYLSYSNGLYEEVVVEDAYHALVIVGIRKVLRQHLGRKRCGLVHPQGTLRLSLHE